jgi:hypothetical protein
MVVLSNAQNPKLTWGIWLRGRWKSVEVLESNGWSLGVVTGPRMLDSLLDWQRSEKAGRA